MAGRNEFVVEDEGERIVLRRGASSLSLVAVLLVISGSAFVLAIRSTAESGRTMGIVIAGLFSLFLLPQVPLEFLAKVVIDRDGITLHRFRRWHYAWGDHLVVTYVGRGSAPEGIARARAVTPWLRSASTKMMLLPVDIGMSVRGRPPRQLAEFERLLADAAQRFGAAPVEVVPRVWMPEDTVR